MMASLTGGRQYGATPGQWGAAVQVRHHSVAVPHIWLRWFQRPNAPRLSLQGRTLRKHDTAIIFVQEAIDTTTAAGKAMLTVIAAFAEMERNFISERTRAALAGKKARGERLGLTRTQPSRRERGKDKS